MEKFEINVSNPISVGKKLAAFGMPTSFARKLGSMVGRAAIKKPEANKLLLLGVEDISVPLLVLEDKSSVIVGDLEGAVYRPSIITSPNFKALDILTNGEFYVNSPFIPFQVLSVKLKVNTDIDTYFRVLLKCLKKHSDVAFKHMIDALFKNCVPTHEQSLKMFFTRELKQERETVFKYGYFHFVEDLKEKLEQEGLNFFGEDPFNLFDEFFMTAQGGCKDSRYSYLRGRVKS